MPDRNPLLKMCVSTLVLNPSAFCSTANDEVLGASVCVCVCVLRTHLSGARNPGGGGVGSRDKTISKFLHNLVFFDKLSAVLC